MRDREFRPRGFEEAHERIPSSVGDADALYNKLLRNESIKHQSEGSPYLESGKQGIDSGDFDYYQSFKPTIGYIKSHVGHMYEADRTVAVQHSEMIARCFYSNSVEEIMQN